MPIRISGRRNGSAAARRRCRSTRVGILAWYGAALGQSTANTGLRSTNCQQRTASWIQELLGHSGIRIPERYTRSRRRPRAPARSPQGHAADRRSSLRPRLAVQTRKLRTGRASPLEHTFRLSAARARHHRLNGIVTCARLRLLGGPGPVQLATSSSRAGRSRTSSHDSSNTRPSEQQRVNDASAGSYDPIERARPSRRASNTIST